jgi:phage-related protein
MQEMPDDIQDEFGRALLDAQYGDQPVGARPFGEGVPKKVMKLVEDFDGDTYRAAYAVEFERCIYLLHVFKKKSKRGRETPREHLEVINERYKVARAHYTRTYGAVGEGKDEQEKD